MSEQRFGSGGAGAVATEAPAEPGIHSIGPVRPPVDFDLHGLVGIRLIDASDADQAVVRRQLGPLPGRLAGEPDLVVRFVDRILPASDLRLVGLDSAYGPDGFQVLRGTHHSRVCVQIPFDALGGRCEIVCERGASAVPLLLGIMNLMVLGRGGLALHASAFHYAGADVLVTGWSKGGKTELLLGFAARGARYIGDEWIYVSPDSARIFGIPEPIRVWDWHLRQLPDQWRRLSRSERLQLEALRLLSGGVRRAARFERARRRPLGRLADLLERQRYVQLRPQRAFDDRFGPLIGAPRTVIFVESHASPSVTVEPIDAGRVADRMVFSLSEERAELMSYYRKFRFAYPERANPLLETAARVEHARLLRFLQGKTCYAVRHPYPPSISELYAAVRSVLSEARPDGSASPASPQLASE